MKSGKLIINGDDKLLRNIKKENVTIIKCGIQKNNHLHFQNNKELIKHLKEVDLSNSIILVKGSRGMKLEEITEYLKKNINLIVNM